MWAYPNFLYIRIWHMPRWASPPFVCACDGTLGDLYMTKCKILGVKIVSSKHKTSLYASLTLPCLDISKAWHGPRSLEGVKPLLGFTWLNCRTSFFQVLVAIAAEVTPQGQVASKVPVQQLDGRAVWLELRADLEWQKNF